MPVTASTPAGRGRRPIRTIGQYSGLVAMVGVALLLLNLVSLRLFARLDLTDKKVFTLSPATRSRLKGLDDVVTVKVYFSKKLPPEMAGLERSTRDVLGELRAHSQGKLQYQFADPESDDQARAEVGRLGIRPVQLSVRTKDKLEAINVYMGMGIFYLDRNRAIPVLADASNLEYDLISAILRVTSEGDKVVTFLGDPEQMDLERKFARLKLALEHTYQVNTHDAKTGPVPAATNTLVVVSPKDLTDREKFEIDQSIMQGKSAVIVLDPLELNEKTFSMDQKGHKLGDLLEHYGVRVNSDLVEDVSSGFASFTQGYFTYTVPYPFFVKVQQSTMARENPSTRGVESVTLYFPSSLDILRSSGEGFQVDELLRTTNQAWSQSGGYFNINPQQQPGADRKSFTLAVALTGKLSSFYKGKPVLSDGGEALQSRSVTEETTNGRVVVVGDSDFLSNQAVGDPRNVGNLTFMMNVVDWLTLGEDLIQIRSKTGVDRPLRETTDRVRAMVKALVTFTVPVLVVLFGLIRYYLRRREQKIYAQLREQAVASSS